MSTCRGVPQQDVRRIGLAGRHLRTLGMSAELAVLAVDSVLDLAADVTLRGDCLRALGADPRWTAEAAAVAAEHFDPDLRAVATAAVGGDPRVWFDRKLTLVLDGVEAAHGAGR